MTAKQDVPIRQYNVRAGISQLQSTDGESAQVSWKSEKSSNVPDNLAISASSLTSTTESKKQPQKHVYNNVRIIV